MPPRIIGVDPSRTSFSNDLKRLPPDIRAEAIRRIAALVSGVIPKSWRVHPLSGYKPTVYSVDIGPNKTYKATFELRDGVAVMLRAGTHKHIDRCPR